MSAVAIAPRLMPILASERRQEFEQPAAAIATASNYIGSMIQSVYFVLPSDKPQGAHILRGKLIAESLQDKLPSNIPVTSIYLYNFLSKEIHNSILIFIKFTPQMLNKDRIKTLQEQNNILILDVLDIWQDKPKFLAFPNIQLYLRKFHLCLVNSYAMKYSFDRYNIKSTVLYHASDPRISIVGQPSPIAVYTGILTKLDLQDIKDYTIESYTRSGFQPQQIPCVHLCFINRTNPYFLSHTSTKLATALATDSIFVSSRVPVFEEILGANYPFFANNEEDFHSLVEKAKSLIQNPIEYSLFLEQMVVNKTLLSFEVSVESYRKLLTEFILNISVR